MAERGRPASSELADQLGPIVSAITAELDAANAAREEALAACRLVIRRSGSSIRAVHRGDPGGARAVLTEAEEALRQAQQVLARFPDLTHAGFLHDAEKEYVEAHATAQLVAERPVAGPVELGVDSRSWMRGLAEAASELRRDLLDRLRNGELARAESLLAAMDDVYDALVVVDYPDALTSGLRRTVDSLRAVLERSRGDVTTTVVGERLRRTIDARR